MSYLSIKNLYKDQTIFLFKECYAMEKINGTSSHISWKYETKEVSFFSGGVSYNAFVALFNAATLKTKFEELFPDVDAIIYGEAYGGACQKMSDTYGKDLKFVAFDVKINTFWLKVPEAENVVNELELEFVAYAQVTTDLANLDAERDADSTQAIRNGMGAGKKREGVVIRPLQEFIDNRGERVIVKHKRDEFRETATLRVVSDEKLQVLTEAKAISEEWVTEERLRHVLDKLPADIGMESTKLVIKAMVEDVYREAKGEIVESKEVTNAIGQKTVALFKQKVQKV